MRNLVVVAHPDDEILGFGATGAKLVSEGESVQPVILCGNVDIRFKRPSDEQLHDDMLAANRLVGFNEPVLGAFPNIRMNTVPHVELVQFIEAQIVQFKPTRIFTHHPSDLNDDHKQIANACMAAARLYQRRDDVPPIEMLAFMEIQSATDWGYESVGTSFRPNFYIEVGDTLEKKIQSLACYRNVMRAYPHPRSEEALRGIAAYRGGQAGQNYSEAFEIAFKRGF